MILALMAAPELSRLRSILDSGIKTLPRLILARQALKRQCANERFLLTAKNLCGIRKYIYASNA
jgi:hypothetical protein